MTEQTTRNPDSSPADRTMTLQRVIDAPRSLVFAAWTDAAQLDHWWGPKGFINATIEADIRPGGFWRYTMHSPDGVDYPNRIDYQEISPGRIRYLHSDDGASDEPPFESTVTFIEQDGRTEVTMRVVFPTEAAYKAAADMGAIELGQSSLECLEAYLLSLPD